MSRITKNQLRIIIGENIKRERISRNMTIYELAELLGQTSGFVGLIERGQRGTTISNLLKLSDIFGVPIDCLIHCAQKEPISVTQQLRSKILGLISDFTESELSCTFYTVKSLRMMKHRFATEEYEKTLEDSN